ncbi:LysR substrate-binding domain-containing protein [Ascidiaceihabitans sp.]|uniref:LysR substrate-binding domain-containing protein n=1 Tax=Ascidiaceihabitans sp. TaxID=1872644 RepID=UPI003297FCDD
MKKLYGIHLSGLRAIEVLGRCGNLRDAAQELGVTSGAVSQQIIKAEAQLDCRLFERNPKGMVPTKIGQQVAEQLTQGFLSLAHGVALATEKRPDAITIAVPPIFAGKWLVWRLDRFSQAHPEVKVRIDASVDLVDPRMGEADACIRVGYGDWPGVLADELFPQRVFPVCAPHLAQRINGPEDLRQVPIVRDTNTMFGWDVWLKPNEMTEECLGTGPEYSDAALCLDAAIAGQGIFLAWETLAQDALAMNQLVAPFPGRFRTGISYWFVEPEDWRRSTPVAAFRSWLVDELAGGRK